MQKIKYDYINYEFIKVCLFFSPVETFSFFEQIILYKICQVLTRWVYFYGRAICIKELFYKFDFKTGLIFIKLNREGSHRPGKLENIRESLTEPGNSLK